MKLSQDICPQGDKVAVLPMKAESITASGIHIPDTVGKQKKPQQGTVLAVSAYLEQVWNTPIANRPNNSGGFVPPESKVSKLQVGDTVLFTEYAGDDLKIRDQETNEDVIVKVLPIESVLAVVKPH